MARSRRAVRCPPRVARRGHPDRRAPPRGRSGQSRSTRGRRASRSPLESARRRRAARDAAHREVGELEPTRRAELPLPVVDLEGEAVGPPEPGLPEPHDRVAPPFGDGVPECCEPPPRSDHGDSVPGPGGALGCVAGAVAEASRGVHRGGGGASFGVGGRKVGGHVGASVGGGAAWCGSKLARAPRSSMDRAPAF